MAINAKTPNDCGYIALYRNQRCEVYAPSGYEAQQRAAKHFRAKKSYEVHVTIAEQRDGSEVVHVPVD